LENDKGIIATYDDWGILPFWFFIDNEYSYKNYKFNNKDLPNASYNTVWI